MATVILKKKHPQDTCGFVRIRIPVKGAEPIIKSLGFKVPEAYWLKKEGRVKKGYSNGIDTTESINQAILSELSAVTDEIQILKANKKAVGREKLKQIVTAPVQGDVIQFMELYIYESSQPGKNGKAKFSDSHIKTLNKIKNRIIKFTGGTLSFVDVDYNFMCRLEADLNSKMNSDTTVPTTLSKFVSVLNEASKRGLFDYGQIATYKVPIYVSPERDYLTLAEVEALKNTLLSGKLTPDLEVVAAFFLVECTAGLRNSDWGKFEIETAVSKRAIKVVTTKTGAPIYIYLDKSPVLSTVVDYIGKKGLKYTFTNQYTNRLLKVLGSISGISKTLTTHVGRHTCATLWLEIGYSKEMVAEVLGVSMKTVEIYAKITRRKLQNEYDKLGGI